MDHKLKVSDLNWISRWTFFIVSVSFFFPRVLFPLMGSDEEITVVEFNQLPREFRIGYLKSGPYMRKLGKNAKVDDLVEEILRQADLAESDNEKTGIAFALATICETQHRNEVIVERALALADELYLSKFSTTSVDINYELLGEKSRPFLLKALSHQKTTTQIQAALRLGRVGKSEDLPILRSVLKEEDASGSKTVAKYMRKSILSIEQREAKSKSKIQEELNGIPIRERESKKSKGERREEGDGKSSGPLLAIFGGMAVIFTFLAVKMHRNSDRMNNI